MADFQIPQDTLLPVLTATLSDAVGALNLTGATVTFQMRLPGASTLKVNANAAIVNAANGQVSYTWAGADTDTPGLYVAWFRVAYGPSMLYAPEPPMVVEVGRGAG